MRAALDAARQRIAALEAEVDTLRIQLREVVKHDELQRADIERYRDEYERNRPNCPERVPTPELQLVFEQVLSTYGDAAVANDAKTADSSSEPRSATSAGDDVAPSSADSTTQTPAGDKTPDKKRRHRHGRRRLDLTKLPVERVELEPAEVKAAGGEGFVRIGEEVSERIGFRPGSYFRIRLVRGKWVPAPPSVATMPPTPGSMPVASSEPRRVLVAPLPDCLWPGTMADTSAISRVIIAKYDDVTPLHRQEHISDREGFALPRSTQCGWLSAAYEMLHRIVAAMFDEARAKAFCIATDATGARVRAKGCCNSWHVFVFIADRDHVVFRFVPEHTSPAVAALLQGFRGYLLSDAAPVYDVLHRSGDVIEVACWFHARRYFWRALETDRAPAMEALAIIRELFHVDRECRDIAMPVRTVVRAQRARPVLAMFDRWVEAHRGQADPRGPLHTAIGYYDNQREALHRFLDDGRLRVDNNISEGALRNLVLGRHNWQWFANKTGLAWYTTFRSLIASCTLHGLNPQDYLEQVLRLAPHWPVTRMLDLSPKYWTRTLAQLSADQRHILVRPWEIYGDGATTLPDEAAAA
jgi:transposase